MKPLVVIFEGVDKSGKTTLLNMFNKVTNFKYIVLDRFTVSSKVYDTMFHRDNRDYFTNVEKNFFTNFNVVIVYCHCKEETVRKRLVDAGEVLQDEIDNISVVETEFRIELKLRQVFKDCKIIMVDTDRDIDECLYDIVRGVYEYDSV